jgi:hypothetical protein
LIFSLSPHPYSTSQQSPQQKEKKKASKREESTKVVKCGHYSTEKEKKEQEEGPGKTVISEKIPRFLMYDDELCGRREKKPSTNPGYSY